MLYKVSDKILVYHNIEIIEIFPWSGVSNIENWHYDIKQIYKSKYKTIKIIKQEYIKPCIILGNIKYNAITNLLDLLTYMSDNIIELKSYYDYKKYMEFNI